MESFSIDVMIPTTTILAAYGHSDAVSIENFTVFSQQFSKQLEQPVIPCVLDEGERALLDAIAEALRGGAVRLVILPLFLSPAEYRGNAVAEAVTLASRRWPFLQFHLSPAIAWKDWGYLAGEVLGEAAAATAAEKIAVVLAAGNGNPEMNSDIAKLTRLVFEANRFGWVETAYTGENGRPTLPEMVERLVTLGADKVVVAPWILFAGTAVAEIDEVATGYSSAIVTPHLAAQPALLDLLVAQQGLALADRSLLPVSWEEVERQLTAELNTHDKGKPGMPAPDEDEFQQLNAKINAILPPRYQERLDEVSAAPMAAADLIFDSEGGVAWDEIFGVDDADNPFCELALAGGPAHRGELLEAVTAEACEEELGKYTAVVAEIERGIEMITGLPTVNSAVPGWVGVRCESEEMAIWLVRAIIVENVMVRREGDMLYLPAGPQFTLKNEIKSIVTVTAKTCHYWGEHLTAQRFAVNAPG